MKKPYVITRGKVIFNYRAFYCGSPGDLLGSALFREIAVRFIERMASRGSPLYSFLTEKLPGLDSAELADAVSDVFRLLVGHTAGRAASIAPRYAPLLAETDRLYDFIERFYNFWRRHERFLYVDAPEDDDRIIGEMEEFSRLVLSTYRKVSENLIGRRPRVYRQLPAGANIGFLTGRAAWHCPAPYRVLEEIPFIKLSIVKPPTIFYTAKNKRVGAFEEIAPSYRDSIRLDPHDWFCFPAKVGELLGFVYFHQDFMSLGLALCNLFETAEPEEIEGRAPDFIMLFGIDDATLPSNTVFFDDETSGLLVGVVRHTEDADYFGYIKKMALTLHNVWMLKRGRLPLHGAMVCVRLKGGGGANIVLVGDSGAGKSETLMALRGLAEEHISDMVVVFDDMGSLGMGPGGKVSGYGTEVGAFLRIDDLKKGYEYGEVDRSIFMNPDKVNARLVMPLTRYEHLVAGHPVDIMLYANNYEQVDDGHPAVKLFGGPDEALQCFGKGVRFAKGTTDEMDLTSSYFGNPFGAPQRRPQHEDCARRYFTEMFGSGVKVGQIRNRLGIEGFEQTGPSAASLALFELIRNRTSK